MRSSLTIAAIVAALLFAPLEAARAEQVSEQSVSLFPKDYTLTLPAAKWKARQTKSVVTYFQGVETRFNASLVARAYSGMCGYQRLLTSTKACVFVPNCILPENGQIEIEQIWYNGGRKIGDDSSVRIRTGEFGCYHLLFVLKIGSESYRANAYFVVVPFETPVSRKTEFELSGQLERIEDAPMVQAQRVRFSLEVGKADSQSTSAGMKITAGPVQEGIDSRTSHTDSTGRTVLVEATDNGSRLMAAVKQDAVKVTTSKVMFVKRDGSAKIVTSVEHENEGIVISVEKMSGEGGKFQCAGK